MMIEQIKIEGKIGTILDQITFFEDTDIIKLLENSGFEVLAEDSNEKTRKKSIKVDWSAWFDLRYDNVTYRLNLYGVGLKDASYDKWTHINCITIDEWNISRIEY